MTPWIVQSMEFSRPEYWSGWSFPSPGDLPNPGMNPALPHCGRILYQLSHKGSPLSGKFIAIHQERRKTSNRQPNFTPKTTGKRKTKNPKISRRKQILKIQAEINEKDMKETIIKINKSWFFEKINKINQPLARLIKNQNQSNKI